MLPCTFRYLKEVLIHICLKIPFSPTAIVNSLIAQYFMHAFISSILPFPTGTAASNTFCRQSSVCNTELFTQEYRAQYWPAEYLWVAVRSLKSYQVSICGNFLLGQKCPHRCTPPLPSPSVCLLTLPSTHFSSFPSKSSPSCSSTREETTSFIQLGQWENSNSACSPIYFQSAQ